MSTNPKNYKGFGDHDVHTLPVSKDWEESIYEIQKDDILTGGEKGLANLQAQQLANRTEWLKKHAQEVANRDKRVLLLQRLANDLYLSIIAKGYGKEGYDGILIDNFEGSQTEIDLTEAKILSVSADKRSLKIDAGGKDIIAGALYQIADKSVCEEVRVSSSAAIGDGKYLVTLEFPLSKSYDLTRAKIMRTNTALNDGKVYGGKTWKEKTIAEINACLTQEDMPNTTASFSFDKPETFDIKDGIVVDGKVVPEFAGGPTGFVLTKSGDFSGHWSRIDSYGNDLDKIIESKDNDIDDVKEAYGIIQESAGGCSGHWMRVDKDGNNLDVEIHTAEEAILPDSVEAVAIVLAQIGDRFGHWIRVDEHGEDLDEKIREKQEKDLPENTDGSIAIVLVTPGGKDGTWTRVDAKTGQELK